jgi:hypothetical protein
MDESKPPIPPGELRFRSAPERTAADIDPPPAELAKSDRPSVAVYYRNQEEVRAGLLIALGAMGVAQVEQPPEPAKPRVGGAKP